MTSAAVSSTAKQIGQRLSVKGKLRTAREKRQSCAFRILIVVQCGDKQLSPLQDFDRVGISSGMHESLYPSAQSGGAMVTSIQ
ncbi:hypothetical protein AQJ54_35915 [Streptomyces griseorubiginosus]|uniref:Uncharacterized protein n=1 Tax=Streptomyces griseorubiginosus TaxID=67304 RepID=A0A117QY35_9ACTN|nr:hypothetical protein AQJ54_35915 [Streptomyces griseorubiginosus]